MSSALPAALRRAASEDLIATSDRLLVATSGGPDSLSLLHALCALRDELGLADLRAAHFDHGLRGEESQADAAFVQAFCDRRGIPCHLGQADVGMLARDRKVSRQVAARSARYYFLAATAEETGANKIATAHTQDDQTETILLNILRGTGLEGLRGIPVRRASYIRPLLGTSRAEVLNYCATHGLAPRQDPSNLLPVYTRNRLRHELLPELTRHYNSGVGDALLRLSQIAARDWDYLQEQAEAALGSLTLRGDPARLVLDADGFRGLHASQRRYVLRAAIRQSRGTLSGITHEHLEAVCAVIGEKRAAPFGITTPRPFCAIRVVPRRVTLTRPASVPGEITEETPDGLD